MPGIEDLLAIPARRKPQRRQKNKEQGCKSGEYEAETGREEGRFVLHGPLKTSTAIKLSEKIGATAAGMRACWPQRTGDSATLYS